MRSKVWEVCGSATWFARGEKYLLLDAEIACILTHALHVLDAMSPRQHHLPHPLPPLQKESVGMVVNYDMPVNVEQYEIRAGLASHKDCLRVVTFLTPVRANRDIAPGLVAWLTKEGQVCTHTETFVRLRFLACL